MFPFLISLTKGLPILFFPRTSSYLHWSVLLFLVSISLISTLIFIISILLMMLDFMCSSFSSSFSCNVKLFDILFYFLRKACITINFLLELLLLHPIDFGMLYFHFHCLKVFSKTSPLISSLIYLLFSSMLISK